MVVHGLIEWQQQQQQQQQQHRQHSQHRQLSRCADCGFDAARNQLSVWWQAMLCPYRAVPCWTLALLCAASCCAVVYCQVRRSTYHEVLKLNEAQNLLQIKGEHNMC
jgi:ribosomal protein L37E